MSVRDLPLGWADGTLGEVGTYLNGRGFKRSEWRERGRQIVRIQDLTGTGGKPNYFIGEVDPRHEVQPGDLLISWAATLGAFVWRGPPAVLNQHIFKVETHINPRFHYWVVQHVLDDLRQRSHGSGMVHVTKSAFEDTQIPMPPLKEQARIVAEVESYTSRLDDAVAGLERVRRNLKHYRASVLHAAVTGRLVPTEAELARAEGREFEPASDILNRTSGERRGAMPHAQREDLPNRPEGWCWGAFPQLVDVISDKGLRVQQRDYRPTGRLPVVDQGEAFVGGYTDDESMAYQGPLPVVVFGDHTRRIKLVSFRFAVGADGVKLLAPTRAWCPGFMAFSLLAAPLASKGYARHFGTVRKLYFLVPPLAEQHRIVTEVERLLSIADGIETAVGASLARASRLRQAVLRWAFEGKLVDQDPSDEPASVLLERIRKEREATGGSKRRPRRRA